MAMAPSDRGAQREPTRTAPSALSLTTLFADVVAEIPDDERGLAERALLAQQVGGCDEDLGDVLGDAPPGTLGFLVVDGVVFKETTLATRSALEVLTAGDILVPQLSAAQQEDVRAVSRYLAHGVVSLGLLGARFRAATARWPRIGEDLHRRLADQSHRASAHLAMLHEPRVEGRITLLFADLSERCGRMTPDGAVIDMSLTHEVIGRLVGARRSTVTLALQTLAEQGALSRVGKDRWMIPRNPEPAQGRGEPG